MFVRRRDKGKASTLYNVTDGYRVAKLELSEVLKTINNMGFPYTQKQLGAGHYNLVVYCPNEVLEFDLRQ